MVLLIPTAALLGGGPRSGPAADAAATSPPAGSAPADFFVALDGNDQWSGTLAAPNAERSDGPFASLERARDAVRPLRAKQAWRRPLVVMLRGGTHPRGAPFVLRPEDSGTAASPVLYAAYPGEKPLLSGSHDGGAGAECSLPFLTCGRGFPQWRHTPSRLQLGRRGRPPAAAGVFSKGPAT